MTQDWPFDQAKNVAAITTVNVIEKKFPILLVTHYENDHSWAFLCGTTNKTEDGRVIGMDEVLKIDPTLVEIADLPPGWSARREQIGKPWHRYKRAFEWLEPWVSVEQAGQQLVDELVRELSDKHVLYGKRVKAIARRMDNDDILVEVDDQNYHYAVVHLTWSGQKEVSKEFPWTVQYTTFEDWVERCMKSDG